MSYLGGKVFAGLLAGAISVSVVAYTGGALVPGIKDDIRNLEKRIVLTSDEAASKIGFANSLISAKNSEIDRLVAEIDRLEGQVTAANAQITLGDSRITEANNNINTANADMTTVKTVADLSVANFDKDQLTVNVVDSQKSIQDSKLTITVVSTADTSSKRNIRVANPNGVDVVVTVKPTGAEAYTMTVPAGDVVYVEKNNAGQMVSFSYTVPATNEVVNTRPY